MSDSNLPTIDQADPPTGSACPGVSSPPPVNQTPYSCVLIPGCSGGDQALREMREGMGLTQVDAADAMGCSQATMSRMEAGKESISLVMLERRANAMGLDVEISLRRRAVER